MNYENRVLHSNNIGDVRREVDRLMFKLQVYHNIQLPALPNELSINWLKFHYTYLVNRLNKEEPKT